MGLHFGEVFSRADAGKEQKDKTTPQYIPVVWVRDDQGVSPGAELNLGLVTQAGRTTREEAPNLSEKSQEWKIHVEEPGLSEIQGTS